jgi:hypothetical protein
MATERNLPRLLGAAFLFVFCASLISGVLLTNVVGSGGMSQGLVQIASQPALVRASAMGQLLTATGVVVLAVLLFAVLKPFNRVLALIALGWWLAEAIVLALIQLGVLGLIPLSQDFVAAGAPAGSFHTGLAAFLYWGLTKSGMAIHMWFYCCGGLIWYALLLRSRYVPQIIPLWGLGAVVLALAAAALQLWGYPVPLWVSIPLAPFELALGFWLLVKGVGGQPEPLRAASPAAG